MQRRMAEQNDNQVECKLKIWVRKLLIVMVSGTAFDGKLKG